MKENKEKEGRKEGKGEGGREESYIARGEERRKQREGQEVRFYEQNKVSPGSYLGFVFLKRTI